MKPGDIGPLMRALLEELEDARIAEERKTSRELAESIDFPLRNVRRAIERLRMRKAQIAAYVKDGRVVCRYHKRIGPPAPVLNIVESALDSQSLLERAWRGSGLGELV